MVKSLYVGTLDNFKKHDMHYRENAYLDFLKSENANLGIEMEDGLQVDLIGKRGDSIVRVNNFIALKDKSLKRSILLFMNKAYSELDRTRSFLKRQNLKVS